MQLRSASAIGILLIAVAGCGPSGKVVPVSGVVKLDGKPAEDAWR